MKEVLEYCKSHWRQLLEVAMALLDVIMVIIFLIRQKKKGNIKDSDIMAYLGEILPGLINNAEALKDGETKLALVVQSAAKSVAKKFGFSLDDHWKALIVDMVESILSTPTKKQGD